MRLLVLFSGGIDSPVAAYLMAKKGAEIILVNFLTQSDKVSQRTIDTAKLLAKSLKTDIKLYSVPHKAFLESTKEILKDNLSCVLCKKMMYRVAQKLAIKCGCAGIITGENIGQVASQTLHNQKAIRSELKLMVVQPLIAYDKEEIITTSKKIGLYEITSKKSDD